jgi:hypothetical protein
MTGRNYLAALMLGLTALSGCSLAEQVIVIEPRKADKAAVSSAAPSRSASAAASSRCSPGDTSGPVCSEKALSKADSARYDSGPVLKPIEKAPDVKPPEAAESSDFVRAVKSWIKTGMHLHGWAGTQ